MSRAPSQYSSASTVDLTTRNKKLYAKCDSLKSQTVQYRERCKKLEGHLSDAHVLLQEASDTLTEDEIAVVDKLKIRNSELEAEISRIRGNRGSRAQSVKSLDHRDGRRSPTYSHLNEYHQIIQDRHNDILELNKELKIRDELQEAAKISHNILVEKLKVSEEKVTSLEQEVQKTHNKIDNTQDEVDFVVKSSTMKPDRKEIKNNNTNDYNRWVFEEQEAQIGSDRVAIARLNTQLEQLTQKSHALAKENASAMQEKEVLRNKIKTLEIQLQQRNGIIQQKNAMIEGFETPSRHDHPYMENYSKTLPNRNRNAVQVMLPEFDRTFTERNPTAKVQLTEIKTIR